MSKQPKESKRKSDKPRDFTRADFQELIQRAINPPKAKRPSKSN